MREVPVFLLFLVLVVPAIAGEEKPAPLPKPLSDEQAAEAVLTAVRAKDNVALKALAEKAEPDPWLVADLLCSQGKNEAAEAFAEAAAHVDTQKLPAYVAAWRTRKPDQDERELLAAMTVAIRVHQPQRVIEATATLSPNLDTVMRLRLRHVRGFALRMARRLDESADVLHGAADAALELGWLPRASRMYRDAGTSAYRGSAFPRALASFEQGLDLAKHRGDRQGAASMLGNIGVVHEGLGNYEKALKAYEQAYPEKMALGDRLGAATTLGNIGVVHERLGDYQQALSTYEKACSQKKALGDKQGAARTRGNIGVVYENLGNYPKALSTFEQVLVEKKVLGDMQGAALTLGNIGIVHARLGNYQKALSIFGQVLADQNTLGDKQGAASTIGNVGVVHQSLGNYQKALSTYEQALAAKKKLGDKQGAALTLGNIGVVHESLRDYQKALSIFERALDEQEALGDKQGAATTLGNVGGAHMRLGNHQQALSNFEQARSELTALGDRLGAADMLANIGTLHRRLGNYQQALSIHEQALSEQKTLGHKQGAATTLGNIGRVHVNLGNYAEARRLFEQSARTAKSLRATPLLVSALSSLARLHLKEGNPTRALGAAQRALTATEALLGGLGQEQGAAAREKHASLFAVGVLAAVREGDAPEALSFLESGRAGALLDALDKREALRWKAESLPPELRRLDLEAHAEESVARHAYDRVVKRGGGFVEIQASSRTLDDATEAVREVAGRIQRELKQQAWFFYPRAKTIEEIEETLEADQALVLYGLCLDEALALVLRKDGERIVSLGKVTEVNAAVEALELTNRESDPKPALDALRKLLVVPLKLEEGVKQVLVSPEGLLCYVPFGALFEQTVAMTPSGTTHVLLREEERQPGKGILALGDPDYAGASETAQVIYHRGRTLSPLPATRLEVEKIGTVQLLGAKASEAGLREALPTSKRWRAVHFACHGLVDIERPMLSSLALSRAGEDDGFLTALEILRTEIPADLAVLSACETATGKIVMGEGIVGLTRAFMFAGAPRVICSLWKVDDDATRALMIKFYELWNPKDDTPALGAAAALKQAQDFIREQDKWKHPYYWAAWALWGLPK